MVGVPTVFNLKRVVVEEVDVNQEREAQLAKERDPREKPPDLDDNEE